MLTATLSAPTVGETYEATLTGAFEPNPLTYVVLGVTAGRVITEDPSGLPRVWTRDEWAIEIRSGQLVRRGS